MRRLLTSGTNGTDSPILVNDYTTLPRPNKPVDFNPQTGVVKLTTIVFLINVNGMIPPFGMDVRIHASKPACNRQLKHSLPWLTCYFCCLSLLRTVDIQAVLVRPVCALWHRQQHDLSELLQHLLLQQDAVSQCAHGSAGAPQQ